VGRRVPSASGKRRGEKEIKVFLIYYFILSSLFICFISFFFVLCALVCFILLILIHLLYFVVPGENIYYFVL
jgi:hypothetical protein